MLIYLRQSRKTLSFTITFLISTLLYSQNTFSDIVTTQTLLQHEARLDLQAHLQQALERDDVISLLQDQGVSPTDAKKRVMAMTDEEAAQLAANFSEMPAGGDVVLLLVIIILVLLLR